MAKKEFTSAEVQELIEETISEENGLEIESLSPSSDGEYFTAILNGDIFLSTLKKIARKVGDDNILISADDFNRLDLFFEPKETDGSERDDYDPYEEERKELTRQPRLEMKHTERFYDAWDDVVPGTEVHRSRTEECELVMKYVNASDRLPIYFTRLDDGIHMEQSEVFTKKARAILAEGHAIGFDGRRYTFENPENLFPIGDEICVRATCDETGNSDAYGLIFFV